MRISLKRPGNYLIMFFAFFGFVLAVTQILDVSPDYPNYDNCFDLVRSQGLDILVSSRFEAGFSIFTFVLAKLFTLNVLVYSWIVVAAMLLKG